MHWRYLYFADADYGDALAQSFGAQISDLAKTEPSAAVFRYRLANGAAHYYFTPAASPIATRFFARPCSAPLPAQRGQLFAGRLQETDAHAQ